MTELLDKVIRLVEQMPESDQDAAAFVLMDYIEHRDDTRLTEAQLAEVSRRLTDPNATYISADEARRRLFISGN